MVDLVEGSAVPMPPGVVSSYPVRQCVVLTGADMIDFTSSCDCWWGRCSPRSVSSISTRIPFPRPTHTSPEVRRLRKTQEESCCGSIGCCNGEIVINVVSQSSRSCVGHESTARPTSMTRAIVLRYGSQRISILRCVHWVGEMRVGGFAERRYPGAPRLASAWALQRHFLLIANLIDFAHDSVLQLNMRSAVKTALRQCRNLSQRRRCCRASVQLSSIGASRSFHCSSNQRTDGVFKELTAMRVKTPWVEALHQQQAGVKEAAKPEIPKDRDLTPRHMSDSYHSVVLPLARDPWLLDTVRLSAHCT